MGQEVKTYRTAMYLRISKEDSTDEQRREGSSIENQRKIILEYMRSKSDLRLSGEFVDAGISGTTFARPAFHHMLQGLEAGEFDCVIVKDLSRFGRNYIESGRYIERIFPMLRIRFIAIHDNIDSIKNQSIINNVLIPFKNLLNDSYSRDISMKVKSHLEIKRKNGDYVGAFPVLGYLKSDRNKNHLVIDPHGAGVVQDIFTLKLLGQSHQGIADLLNAAMIPSPAEYKKELGLSYESGFQKNEKALWSPAAVLRILKNEVYTGMMVQGRQSVINYKTKKRLDKEEALWSKVRDTHEAVLDPYQFQAVQRMLQRDMRKSPKETVLFALAGLVFCAACQNSMIRKFVRHKNHSYCYYICSSYKRKQGCSSHSIRADELQGSVAAVLFYYLELYVGIKKISLNGIRNRLQHSARIKKSEQCRRLRKLNAGLEQDFREGLLTEEEYLSYKAEYGKRLAAEHESAGSLVSSLLKKDSFDRSESSLILRFLAVLLIEQVAVLDKNRIVINFCFRSQYPGERDLCPEPAGAMTI